MAKRFNLTREIGFDAAHRVMNHAGRCKNLHGHRYTVEVSIEGFLVDEDGASDEGMVIDFAQIKQILMNQVHERFDHATIVFKDDLTLLEALNMIDGHTRTVVVPYLPTTENIARDILDIMNREFGQLAGGNYADLRCTQVKLKETPTTWVTVTNQD